MFRIIAHSPTGVFNFVFADDAPDKMQNTIKLFDEIGEGRYLPYTSDYVVEELQRASEPKQSQMIGLITRHNMVVLPDDTETRLLADIYVWEGIIPAKYATDALHIAATTVNNLDYIVNFNFKHIVNETARLSH